MFKELQNGFNYDWLALWFSLNSSNATYAKTDCFKMFFICWINVKSWLIRRNLAIYFYASTCTNTRPHPPPHPIYVLDISNEPKPLPNWNKNKKRYFVVRVELRGKYLKTWLKFNHFNRKMWRTCSIKDYTFFFLVAKISYI